MTVPARINLVAHSTTHPTGLVCTGPVPPTPIPFRIAIGRTAGVEPQVLLALDVVVEASESFTLVTSTAKCRLPSPPAAVNIVDIHHGVVYEILSNLDNDRVRAVVVYVYSSGRRSRIVDVVLGDGYLQTVRQVTVPIIDKVDFEERGRSFGELKRLLTGFGGLKKETVATIAARVARAG